MRDRAKHILEILNETHPTYLVGGDVRDSILGRIGKDTDIDIATKATPEQVTSIFESRGHRVVPTGIVHGTVTVIIDDFSFEITTFRKDVECHGRNATIEFADTIEDDLSRRDFTINAIAHDILTGTHIDPFDGKLDIERGIIRTVGDAKTRFSEDYLRMIRAFRFSAQLNFEIAKETEQAIKELVEEKGHEIWEHVSVERLKMEIDKCFKDSEKPSIFFKGLERVGILEHILPELYDSVGFEQNKYHEFDVFIHTMNTLDSVSEEFPLIRWSALFHDLGKVPTRVFNGEDYNFIGHELVSMDIAREIMEEFKFPNSEAVYILNLIKHHMRSLTKDMKRSTIRRLISKVGPEYIDAFMHFKRADNTGKGLDTKPESHFVDIRARIEEALTEETPAFNVKDLAISGKDVMEQLNIPPGPGVGYVLKELFELVLEDSSLNTREELISRIK